MKRLSEFLFILYSATTLYLAIVAFFRGEDPEEDDGDWDEERRSSRKKKKRKGGLPRSAFL